MAAYARFFSSLPALYEEAETGVTYQKYAGAHSIAARFRHGLTWLKHSQYLKGLLRSFRACTVASEPERLIISRLAPPHIPVVVIPNCLDLETYRNISAPRQAHRLIYSGSFRYFANHEAMVWFVGEVLPKIRTVMPEVELIITGDHAGLPLPPADNVTLTGHVEDVRPLVASASISLAPLLVGGGTRLKILEAMALGTPVVATSKGAEGLEARPGEHYLQADTVEAFAEAVVRILNDSTLRQRLSENAYRLVNEQYNLSSVIPRLMELLSQAAQR
jgi:glycosyltransferase involved in cell wall biosynthesis